ncbi:recombinase family protein [Cupriavidus basilensis]
MQDEFGYKEAARRWVAGFTIQPRHVIAETVSGSVPASERPGFSKLLDKLDEGGILVVTKLDRLGRDTADVLATVIGWPGLVCMCSRAWT